MGGIWISDYEGRLYFAIGFEVNDERERNGGFVVNAVLMSGERAMVTCDDTEAAAFKQLQALAERLKAERA